MGVDRRQALWEAQALKDAPALPIFAHADAAAHGAEPVVHLPKMPKAEHVVADYQTLRLSLKAHPMSFYRASLRNQGFACNADLPRKRHGARVTLAGLVLIRQRPGTAKGVCFITLEDETGVANLVVWPDLFKANRSVVMGARLLVVQGRVQTDGQVIHVVAERLEDRSDRLLGLMEAGDVKGDQTPDTLPGQVGNRTHPRNVRVIPKSRDFH